MIQPPPSPRVPAPPGDEDETVQDNRREQLMREVFDLRVSGEGRSGADAVDERGNPYELKSTTKSGVSTTRDVGPHTIEKWRTRYWLVMKGRNTKSQFVVEAYYFLHPDFLSDWLTKYEASFNSDLALLSEVLRVMESTEFSAREQERINSLVRRGLTVNNPHIPWSYIQSHGIPIEEDYPNRLRRLVEQYPLKRS